MARKRMFDIEIINQDSFYELPMDAKALYFLLGMEADDEGFINPKKVLRLYGGTEDSIKILITKGYLIPFKSGVVVITDWKRNNYLDKNKIKGTIYIDEKENIFYNNKTEKYELINESLARVKRKLNESLPSIEENSIEEDSIEESSIDIYGEEIAKGQPKEEPKVEILDSWEIQFDKFYKKYPRKVKKQDVKKWFQKNKPSNELFSSMLNSLEQFRASKDWQKDGGQFIPYPSTWLNQKRWEDENVQGQSPMSALQRAWNRSEENG